MKSGIGSGIMISFSGILVKEKLVIIVMNCLFNFAKGRLLWCVV